MYRAEVTFDVDSMMKNLTELEKVQLPFASSLALNTMTKDIREDLRDRMKSTFENPVPFTLNSLFVSMSTKDNLTSVVGLKEFATKGNPASKYLLPHIQGGPAYYHRFQKSLRSAGLLGPNEYAIPTQSDELQLNRYGNVRSSMYTEILYSLKAYRDISSHAYMKRSGIKRAKRSYVARTTGAHNSSKTRNFYPGIYLNDWNARQNKESALFWFQRKAPEYKVKYPLSHIAEDFAKDNFNKYFGRAYAKALATAR
ncbi:MAG: hypothetical protein EBR05_11030 [Marivivens sp.]|nr:hypothetical protein [Marivivens sp.]